MRVGTIPCVAIHLPAVPASAAIARQRTRAFAAGHGAEFDELCREEGRFAVVRKPDGPLGEIADATDPRREPA